MVEVVRSINKIVRNTLIVLSLIILIWKAIQSLIFPEYIDLFTAKLIAMNASKRNEMDEMDDSKVRILISGYGHSGTTFLQQFIGEVLFDKNNSFYLFEATHTQKLKYFAKYYLNISTIKQYLNDDYVRSQILSHLYQCKFYKNIKYESFIHSKVIRQSNDNLNDMTSNALTKKCLSSKYLIFKEIDYHNYQYNYDYLLQQFPNLIIFAMIRNPLKHTVSFKRLLMPWMAKQKNHFLFMTKLEGIDNAINLICHQQLNDIKYAIQNWDKYNYNLLKMETLFKNVDNESVTHSIIQYFSNIFWNKTVDTNYLDKVNKKYIMMQHNVWEIGKMQPLQNEPNDKDISYIKNNCIEFMRFTQYVT